MKKDWNKEQERIQRALSAARSSRPAYGELYPFLEALFAIQLTVKKELELAPLDMSQGLVETKWREGFPLLKRWEFPIDVAAAERVLLHMEEHIPAGNEALKSAHGAMRQALSQQAENKRAVWESFMHHEWEPWEEWVDTSGVDLASLVFWSRAGLRPSIEWTAEDLLSRFALPAGWVKGYCPVCGSLPALLFLRGEGERRGYCSWCGAEWGLYRMQCPHCDNRLHESLGYLYTEAEPLYHVHYCQLCKTYFKQVDLREKLDDVYFPLEEWTTLHLDLLARQAGWKQPESPSPIVYDQDPA